MIQAPPMTPPAIYAVMVQAGFPKEVATTMTAIALRESAGVMTAHNGDATTGDDSYGLLQINMRVPQIAALMAKNGISTADLLTAGGNAKAGFLLWGGSNKNLEIAWYITKPVYQQKYESHLPVAQMAALGL